MRRSCCVGIKGKQPEEVYSQSDRKDPWMIGGETIGGF